MACNHDKKHGISDPQFGFNTNHLAGPGYDYEVSLPGINNTGYNYIPPFWIDPVAFDETIPFSARQWHLSNGQTVRWVERHRLEIIDPSGNVIDERINPFLDIIKGLKSGFKIAVKDEYQEDSFNYNLANPLTFVGEDGLQITVGDNKLIFKYNGQEAQRITTDENSGINLVSDKLTLNYGRIREAINPVLSVNGDFPNANGEININVGGVSGIQQITSSIPGTKFVPQTNSLSVLELPTADVKLFRDYIKSQPKPENENTATNGWVVVKDSNSTTGYKLVDVNTLITSGGGNIGGLPASPTAPQSPAQSNGFAQSQFSNPSGNVNGSTAYTNGSPMLLWSPVNSATSYEIREGATVIATGVPSNTFTFSTPPSAGNHTYSIYSINANGKSTTGLSIGAINVQP